MLASRSLRQKGRGLLTRLFCSNKGNWMMDPRLKELDFRGQDKISELVKSKKGTYSNLNGSIIDMVDRQIYKTPNHPLRTLTNRLREFYTSPKIKRSKLQEKFPSTFMFAEDLSPVVKAENNFDKILIPKNHVSRKRSDTYYLTEDVLLRTHTSAHQHEMLSRGFHDFCVLGDVYRKDEIDATHYPVFHQMEAVKLYKVSDLHEHAVSLLQASASKESLSSLPVPQASEQNRDYKYFENIVDEHDMILRLVIEDLQETHINLMKYILGDGNIQYRWNPDYFPFTEPSYELEIYLRDRWLEVLGSGVVHKQVLANAGINPQEYIGWASGIGLERIAMILFDIPDIRLFWSQDPRFINQFEEGKITKFKPFSKYPSCFKDISFYLPEEAVFEENEIYEVIRERGGDLIENVELVDFFHNKKQRKVSRCYRIHYRSLERTLTNEEIDRVQMMIRGDFAQRLGVELR